jgi:predicted RNase H-like HicB family nuclease
MTRKYSLVIEGDPIGYSAYVPELPTILVTGRSVEELTDHAAEAIRGDKILSVGLGRSAKLVGG